MAVKCVQAGNNGKGSAMKNTIATALVLAASLGVASAQPATNAIDTHLANAKRAAGLDFPGALVRLCLVPRATEGGPRGGPRTIPDRSTWYAEPTKMFDNLYFVGTKIHSSWALKTSQGIIVIDTLFDYASEPEIVEGLKKLGLDPAQVKYVIISHAHGDHDQGAALLQSRYGAKVVMGAPDWDATLKRPADAPGGVPKRDIAVGPEGMKLTLGDETVTIVATPGHTPGTLSLIFPVTDRGKSLTVAYSGGTAFNFPDDVAHYDIYIDSQHRFAQAAADAGATVLMSNHSEFDNAYTRSRLVKVRMPGEQHPYAIGADAIARYFTMTSECAEARKLELEAVK
jgi:metallo-beta-lactamase class B